MRAYVLEYVNIPVNPTVKWEPTWKALNHRALRKMGKNERFPRQTTMNTLQESCIRLEFINPSETMVN
ncbi:hypothetical protein F511_35158 [Dorcoceras hygrometricum]|uniref:Uncharacterized protein n=1 Tax=Dorcoceras hygrometricum TaxID=472368 RepID=A0A2Z7DIP8_9LAMI|nr:hypothetical protein F511_35158 [Dorcoceras hygrometricum]